MTKNVVRFHSTDSHGGFQIQTTTSPFRSLPCYGSRPSNPHGWSRQASSSKWCKNHTHHNPQNAPRIHSLLSQSPLIQILQLQFPSHQPDLPHGCENFDSLPSLHLVPKFLTAISLLCCETEHLFSQLSPKPCCIVSDMALPWTIQVADKFNVPRLVFYSFSALYLLCMANLRATDFGEKIMAAPDSQLIPIPNLPDPIQVTKSQLIFTLDPEFLEWENQMAKADSASYGFIVNSFDGLEPKYMEEFKKSIGTQLYFSPKYLHFIHGFLLILKTWIHSLNLFILSCF